MRRSIWAQSCDSVPPAPAWMDTIAVFRSCSPERTTASWKSRRPRARGRARRGSRPPGSRRLPPAPSPTAAGARPARGSARRPGRRGGPARSARGSAPGRAWASSQNDGAAISVIEDGHAGFLGGEVKDASAGRRDGDPGRRSRAGDRPAWASPAAGAASADGKRRAGHRGHGVGEHVAEASIEGGAEASGTSARRTPRRAEASAASMPPWAAPGPRPRCWRRAPPPRRSPRPAEGPWRGAVAARPSHRTRRRW